jgi:phage baseplate assembly protein V
MAGRIGSMVALARVGATKVMGGIRSVQLLIDAATTRDDTPLAQHYGVASRPHPGADAVVLFMGGDRSRGVVIATNDRRHQIQLSEGEVAIHDDQGLKIHLTRAGIVIDGGGKPVIFQNTPEVIMPGKLTTQGDITSAAKVNAATDVTIGARSFNTHTHPENGTGGGITGTPV